MNIPVLVERVAANGYRARSGEPLALTAEGATEEEAVQKLEDAVKQRMNAGAKILHLTIDTADAPWKALRGILRDDPMYDEWRQAMEEYRRQVDQGPDIP
jgi:phage-related minor tail protein